MSYKINDEYYYDEKEKQHIKNITLFVIVVIFLILTSVTIQGTIKKNAYLSFMYNEECTLYGGELIYVKHSDQPKCFQHEIILNDYYGKYLK